MLETYSTRGECFVVKIRLKLYFNYSNFGYYNYIYSTRLKNVVVIFTIIFIGRSFERRDPICNFT